MAKDFEELESAATQMRKALQEVYEYCQHGADPCGDPYPFMDSVEQALGVGRG